MQVTFSPEDAQLVGAFLASVLVPFVVALLKRESWPRGVKFALAIAVAAVGGIVSQYAAGALSTGSAVVAALGVFTASQTHYASWFYALGLDDWLEDIGSVTKNADVKGVTA